MTTSGDATIDFTTHYCRNCRCAYQPTWVDQASNITPAMRRKVLDLTCEVPFERARQHIEIQHGLVLSTSWLQSITEHASGVAKKVLDTWAETPAPASATELYMIQMDGTMIQLRNAWQEAKVAVVCKLKRGKDGEWHPGKCYYVACRGNVEMFESELERLFAKLALKGSQVISVSDGALWIRKLVERHFPNAVQVLDFYHACEHLTDVVEAIFGKASPLCRDYHQEFREKMKQSDEGAKRIIEFIDLQIDGSQVTEQEKAILIRERAYFDSNADRMKYKSLKNDGLPIGSGLIEGTHRSLIQKRMKLSGQHWSEEGADQMIRLRLLRANNLMDNGFLRELARAA